MSKLKVTTIANVADSESTDVTNVINGSAKAWVNFNGTGTVAIRQSFNVSSITDNGTGDYTVNFTTAMADANYVASALSGVTGATTRIQNDTTAFAATSFRIATVNVSNSATDSPNICVSIFR